MQTLASTCMCTYVHMYVHTRAHKEYATLTKTDTHAQITHIYTCIGPLPNARTQTLCWPLQTWPGCSVFYCEYTVVCNVSKSYAFTNPKNSSKFQEVYLDSPQTYRAHYRQILPINSQSLYHLSLVVTPPSLNYQNIRKIFS